MNKSFLVLIFSLFFSLVTSAQVKDILKEIDQLKQENKANRERIEKLLSELKDEKMIDDKKFEIDIDKELDYTLDFSLKLIESMPDLENVFKKIQNNPKTKKIENSLLKLMNEFKSKFEDEIKKIPNNRN